MKKNQNNILEVENVMVINCIDFERSNLSFFGKLYQLYRF